MLGGVISITLFITASVGAAALTQGFLASSAIPTGSVVSITKGSSNSVEKTTQENESSLVGVATNSNTSLIDLQSAGSQILVALSGETTMLVTDFNGEIKKGDMLSISPISGVGMLYSTDVESKKIIANAGQDFNSKSTGATNIQMQDAGGGQKTVSVGSVSVKLVLSDKSSVVAGQNQNILSSFGEKVTGKQTTPMKSIIGLIVTVGAFVLAGMILNGSVRGGFISMGRNPLSRDSIVNGMLRAAILALVIIAMGLAGAYLILLV